MKNKYNINQEVFIFYNTEYDYHITKAMIKEITLTEEGLFYYFADLCDEFTEEQVFDNIDSLLKAIKDEFE